MVAPCSMFSSAKDATVSPLTSEARVGLYLNYLFQTLPNIPKERFSECLPWNPAVQEICSIPKTEK